MLAKRHELKYFLDVETAEDIRRDLKSRMQVDPHCQQGDSYFVNSLYFDTSDYEFFAHKIEGLSYRHKIRLRTYEENADTVFLEMKKKINNCIFKTRASAPFERLRPLLQEDRFYPEGIFNGHPVFSGVDEILYIARQYQVVPAVGVCYRRRAYMGIKDKRLRVTFDENVAAAPRENGLSAPEQPKLLFRPDLVVLEIKVDNYMPLWLAHIIQKYNLHLRSISKYCHAVMVENVHLRDMRY
jgi:SPX domain protein involved in polyphosphate accumulation